MATFSTGFTGRRKRGGESAALTPGQYVTDGEPPRCGAHRVTGLCSLIVRDRAPRTS